MLIQPNAILPWSPPRRVPVNLLPPPQGLSTKMLLPSCERVMRSASRLAPPSPHTTLTVSPAQGPFAGGPAGRMERAAIPVEDRIAGRRDTTTTSRRSCRRNEPEALSCAFAAGGFGCGVARALVRGLLAPRDRLVLLANRAASAAGLSKRRRQMCRPGRRQGQQDDSDQYAPLHAGPRTSLGHCNGQTSVPEDLVISAFRSRRDRDSLDAFERRTSPSPFRAANCCILPPAFAVLPCAPRLAHRQRKLMLGAAGALDRRLRRRHLRRHLRAPDRSISVGAARPPLRDRRSARRRRPISRPADGCARGSPDGYTLLLITTANIWNAALQRQPQRQLPIRDIVPIASIVRGLGVLEVSPSFPGHEPVPEFIAYARANPGKINMGSARALAPRSISTARCS